MKYNTLFIALLIGAVASIQVTKEEAGQDGDLDALMDKYDDQETQKNKPKPVAQTTTKDGVTVTKGDIQDAELRILQGNSMAESSQKSYDDDLYNNAIDLHATDSKTDKGTRILTKENALEACTDLFEKKDDTNTPESQEKLKKKLHLRK